jgi:hypothetical protein
MHYICSRKLHFYLVVYEPSGYYISFQNRLMHLRCYQLNRQ